MIPRCDTFWCRGSSCTWSSRANRQTWRSERTSLNAKAEEYIVKSLPAPGLVLLQLIFKAYASTSVAQQLFHINDLQKVQVRGNLENFQNTWNYVVGGLPETLADSVLEHIYYVFEPLCEESFKTCSGHFGVAFRTFVEPEPDNH